MHVTTQKFEPALPRERAEGDAWNTADLEIAGDRNHLDALPLEKRG